MLSYLPCQSQSIHSKRAFRDKLDGGAVDVRRIQIIEKSKDSGIPFNRIYSYLPRTKSDSYRNNDNGVKGKTRNQNQSLSQKECNRSTLKSKFARKNNFTLNEDWISRPCHVRHWKVAQNQSHSVKRATKEKVDGNEFTNGRQIKLIYKSMKGTKSSRHKQTSKG